MTTSPRTPDEEVLRQRRSQMIRRRVTSERTLSHKESTERDKKARQPIFNPTADISEGIGRRALPEENPDKWQAARPAPEYNPIQPDRAQPDKTAKRDARRAAIKRQFG